MVSFRMQKYEGGSGEPRSVSARIDHDTIKLSGTGGGTTIALADVDLEIGGHSAQVIKLIDRTSGIVLVSDNPRLLITLSKPSCPAVLREKARSARASMPDAPRRRVLQRLAIAAGLLIGIASVYKGIDLLSEVAVDRISPQLEEKLGSLNVSDEELDTRSHDAARVAAIGRRLVEQLPANPYHFHFYIKTSDQLNAFAIPGGSIVVLSQMLKEVTSDDELAGILGHEIAHVLHRDTLRGALHSAGTGICLQIIVGGRGQDTSRLATLLGLARDMDSQKFSRDEEASADLTGVQVSKAAGYDAHGLVDFVERLKQRHSGADNKVLGFLSDHPLPADRIEAIEKEIARLEKQPDKSLTPER